MMFALNRVFVAAVALGTLVVGVSAQVPADPNAMGFCYSEQKKKRCKLTGCKGTKYNTNKMTYAQCKLEFGNLKLTCFAYELNGDAAYTKIENRRMLQDLPDDDEVCVSAGGDPHLKPWHGPWYRNGQQSHPLRHHTFHTALATLTTPSNGQGK